MIKGVCPPLTAITNRPCAATATRARPAMKVAARAATVSAFASTSSCEGVSFCPVAPLPRVLLCPARTEMPLEFLQRRRSPTSFMPMTWPVVPTYRSHQTWTLLNRDARSRLVAAHCPRYSCVW